MDLKPFLVPANRPIQLCRDYDPGDKGGYADRAAAEAKLLAGIEELTSLQDVLYADNRFAVLVIFQAMDAAGKDGTIKHVMKGVNPQGCQVFSFKAPSAEELDHDYLWRSTKSLPERGRIGIFNRSYYEEVLIARVHPEILAKQNLPAPPKTLPKTESIWQQRFQEINNFEQYLTANGVVVIKFFLNLSKSEQKKRFLERIENPKKNWKFSASDIQERQFWEDYQAAYADLLHHTSTKWAPWYVIPADTKWYCRLVVAHILCDRLKRLNLQYPQLSATELRQLQEAKRVLEAE